MRTLRTKRGKTVDTPYSDDEAVHRVQDLLVNGQIDNDFVRSLVGNARRLTPDQMTWVHVYAVGSESEASAADVVEGVDLLTIVALMNKAAVAQKKWPRIVLVGLTLIRKPNADVLVRNASKQRVAIIDKVGRLHRGSMNDVQLDTLRELADDPGAVAAQHGVATGRCCFCNTLLSTAESRSVGYGPVCAGKFGLPWGKLSVRVRKAQLAARIQEAENELAEETS